MRTNTDTGTGNGSHQAMTARRNGTLQVRALVAMAALTLVATPMAQAAAGRILVGTDQGVFGNVKAFTSRSLSNTASFFAYSPSFNGGVRVAAGDVNGDGAPDIITGTGAGTTHVKVFSGRDLSEVRSFLAYGSATGGVYVAVGDINGDELDDIVTGAGPGAGPHVKVFDGRTGTEVRSFFAYSQSFMGGVRVASGDVNGDGRADIIVATGPGGGPHIKVFDGVTGAELRSFFAYDVSFTGGVSVAAGDVNGDGRADIVTGAGPGAGPHVKVFDGRTGTEIRSFFAYPPTFSGGVYVAAGDVDGDGRAEVVTGPGNGATPHVKVFSGPLGQETASFFAYPQGTTNGVFVAASSMTGPRLKISRGKEEVQLEWPAGCVCELQGSEDVTDRKGWSVLEVRPTESGNALGMLLPAVQKYQYFQLECDGEAIRP